MRTGRTPPARSSPSPRPLRREALLRHALAHGAVRRVRRRVGEALHQRPAAGGVAVSAGVGRRPAGSEEQQREDGEEAGDHVAPMRRRCGRGNGTVVLPRAPGYRAATRRFPRSDPGWRGGGSPASAGGSGRPHPRRMPFRGEVRHEAACVPFPRSVWHPAEPSSSVWRRRPSRRPPAPGSRRDDPSASSSPCPPAACRTSSPGC